LRVVVCVDVDESRRDGEPARVDRLAGWAVRFADRDETTVADPDVTTDAGSSRP
jgi:hypothetical protein